MANPGAVGLETEPAMEFAGGGTVGRGWFGRQEFGEQSCEFERPIGMVIAAGASGRPSLGVALGISLHVTGIERVKACVCQAQFAGDGLSGELAGAMAGQEVTDERSGQTFDQL